MLYPLHHEGFVPDYDTPESGSAGLDRAAVLDLYGDLQAKYAARNDEYRQAAEKYDGQHWDGTNLVASEDRYSLTINYLRPAVDMAVQQLIGKLPAMQVVPPGVDEDSRRLAEQLEALLYHVWRESNAELTLRRVAHNVVLKRRGFVYEWWDPTANLVRFRSVAPENLYPVMDGDEIFEMVMVSTSPTRLLQRRYPKLASLIQASSDSDDVIHTDVASPTPTPERRIGETRIIDWFDRDGNWTRVMGGAVHRQKLGYNLGRVPFVEFVNNLSGDSRDPHSEIDDAIELNQYLDQVVSQVADIIKKYSNPPVIDNGSGQSPQAVKRAIQGDGSVIPVRKDGTLRYLLWEGTMPEMGQQIERIRDFIHDLTGKPRSAYGQTVTNQSGVMTNLSLTPTVAATESRETLFGHGLRRLNSDILKISSEMGKDVEFSAKGVRLGRTPFQMRQYQLQLTGAQISGWTENRIKWPSALRVDDPVYVQNELAKSQATATDPPKQSLYTTLENLGIEDVEAEMDRIALQLEDPRLHPDRMMQAVSAATALSDSEIPPGMEGLSPSGGMSDPAMMNEAAESGGSPHRSTLVDSAKDS